MPQPVVEYLAGQLEVRRPGVVRDYMMREMRLSPYMYAHINVHGHYTFTAPYLGGARRPLRAAGTAAEE